MVEEYSLKMPLALPTRPILLRAGRITHQQEEEKVPEGGTTVSPDYELRLVARISNHGHRVFPFGCQITEDGVGVFTLARSEGKLWNR